MPRGQGGPSVVENGLVLCGPWSTVTKGGCHYLKTITDLQIRREWLDDDQIAWLAEVGWVTWGEDGVARGRGWKHFADVS